MYDKYNVVVRARGGHAMASAEHLVKKFVAICRGNTCVAPRRVSRRISRRISRSYATTIHAINSASISANISANIAQLRDDDPRDQLGDH